MSSVADLALRLTVDMRLGSSRRIYSELHPFNWRCFFFKFPKGD
jgi:hypothetical protein